jgi:hypothetical protein
MKRTDVVGGAKAKWKPLWVRITKGSVNAKNGGTVPVDLSKFDHLPEKLLPIVWLSEEMKRGGYMLTPLRKPIHAIRIVEKILKESAQPRQSASVRAALEKMRKTPSTRAAKARRPR